MSAWLVTKEHIDVLVTGAIGLKLIEPGDATTIGDMLWQENVKSLQARYGDERGMPEPGSYSFTARPHEDLSYIFKQVACYDYQACEHDSYPESGARKLVDAMKAEITKHLGCDPHRHPGWDAHPWGVSSDG